MHIGFDTIGNATLICYDGAPILATDPWIEGSAYFGSWAMSHVIPQAQRQAVMDCPYIWFSHGHPDHLNFDSMSYFAGKTILLPDHVGGRIHAYFAEQGYDTRVVETKQWVTLSDHLKIMVLPDFNQDAVLLVDLNGRLIVNHNDSNAFGWTRWIKRVIKRYPTSILLCLTGWGDADHIHYFTENGEPIAPTAVEMKRQPLGRSIAAMVDSWGATHFAPFSSHHRYQRSDSVWANDYVTPQTAYFDRYVSNRSCILPAHLRYDCETDTATPLKPDLAEPSQLPPEAFGDHWSDAFDADDTRAIRAYFDRIEYLKTYLGFINFRVGGRDHIVDINRRQFARGVTFEAPRYSLMTAVAHEIFDDLLIGNFMKTTLHGTWEKSKLYPNFTPYVAKYADNGRAKSADELRSYFRAYRQRAPLDYVFDCLGHETKNMVRARVGHDAKLYKLLKRSYWQVKKTFA